MSSYSTRRVKKRRDLMPIMLLLASLVVLPVLAFAGWKVLNKPPPAQTAQVVVKKRVVEIPSGDLPDPTAFAAGHKARNIVRDDLYPPGDPRYESQHPRGGNLSTGGAYGAGGGDASTAIDKIAANLNTALSIPRKVLVVWLFDATASADSVRRSVISEMPQMYQRLKPPKGDDESSPDTAPILSLVAQYSDKVDFITSEPIAGTAEIDSVLGKITSADGHVENTFAAVESVVDRVIDYRKKKNRYVTIVLVTDEVGDDRSRVDAVIAKLTPVGIPVQVVGPSALFGRAEGAEKMAEGSPPAGEMWVVQGPDSHDPDWVHLEYPSGSGDDLDIESGVGPYQLARLCRETDGEYFAIPRSPLSNMHPIAPEYMSEQAYNDQLQANKAKKALVDAAKLGRAPVQSHMVSTFSETEDVARVRALDSAQKPVAKVMPAIDLLYNTLKTGEGDLAKLSGSTDKRWRAAFELALGRAGAARVRHQGYIEMTAQMKSGRKFQDEKHDTWVLERSNDPMGISALDKLAAKSREYLTDVVKQYPNTPWAAAAQRELDEPISYKWVER
ncbi:MAG TPA: vWA domain-containing protein [Pirellulales bacterium]|nr:vWA domain-containing protein [Pirellulales bacterium]